MRRGLSSVYGFVVIFLLVMASLQVSSSVLGSLVAVQGASEQAHQLEQSQQLERITLVVSGGNLTATNSGAVSSTVEYLILRNATSSAQLRVGRDLPAGGSMSLSIPKAASVLLVTGLGNVFAGGGAAAAAPGGLAGWEGVGGPQVEMQLFQDPFNSSLLFVTEGPVASALSPNTGKTLWRFDAGRGVVTSVLPLASGYAFISVGYYGQTQSADLYEVGPSGQVLASYSVRLLRAHAGEEVGFADSDLPPSPLGSEPVQRGADSLYALYDGWFYSYSAPAVASFTSDEVNLLGSDSADFYFYRVWPNSGTNGCGPSQSNRVTFSSFLGGPSGVSSQWSSDVYFGVCNIFPQTLISSSLGGGVVAALFANDYYPETGYFSGPFRGSAPFLAAISTSGRLLYSGYLDHSGYSSVATDGSNVFLSLPAQSEVERIPLTGQAPQVYQVGIRPATLLYTSGSLFAISNDTVKVFDSAMNLRGTISFRPLYFYALSNALPSETSLHAPSFVLLNGTTYAALLRNASGFGELVLGKYP